MGFLTVVFFIFHVYDTWPRILHREVWIGAEVLDTTKQSTLCINITVNDMVLVEFKITSRTTILIIVRIFKLLGYMGNYAQLTCDVKLYSPKPQ